MSNREFLFKCPRSEFKLEFFRGSGNGGQKRNKTSNCCRITHIPSGAVGESREERSQTQNKKNALERLVATKTFKLWVKMKAAAIELGHQNTEKLVDSMMTEKNLEVEEITTWHCDNTHCKKTATTTHPYGTDSKIPEGWLTYHHINVGDFVACSKQCYDNLYRMYEILR